MLVVYILPHLPLISSRLRPPRSHLLLLLRLLRLPLLRLPLPHR
jgi:hypothetical protein